MCAGACETQDLQHTLLLGRVFLCLHTGILGIALLLLSNPAECLGPATGRQEGWCWAWQQHVPPPLPRPAPIWISLRLDLSCHPDQFVASLSPGRGWAVLGRFEVGVSGRPRSQSVATFR
jgi:hypothetical protein